MEGPVKGKQLLLLCAIMLPVSVGLIGCKDDSAAVAALQELTDQLSGEVVKLNEELTAVAETLQTCMKNLAETKGEAVVISTTDPSADAPALEGEASLASLEALKTKLNETLTKQKAALGDLKTKVEGCAKDLEAAEAKAAQDAARKEAARQKRKTESKKPTAVKEAEKTGAPTKGTRSRY